VPKNRLEAFADGIFAFAATLLILNLAVEGKEPLSHELAAIWPGFLAYAISFTTIGIIWINHHTLMHQIAHTDRFFLVLNVFFLGVIAFIPFPTRLLALHVFDGDARAAALLYGVTLFLTAVFFNAVWRYAAWDRRLIREDADAKTVVGISRSYALGPFIYLAATAIAFANPVAGSALYASIALFYVLESSIFGRA